MNDTTFIYALNDPRTGECRYVGKADNPFKRFKKHLLGAATSSTHKNCWILGLKAMGLTPTMDILDEVPKSQWQLWESEYIKVFRMVGVRLTNLVEGGLGGGGPMSGKRHTEETRRKQSLAKLGKRYSPEARARMSAAKKGHKYGVGRAVSEETRLKQSLSHLGRPSPNRGKTLSLETREKISAAKKGRGQPWSALRRENFEKKKR